MFEIRNLKKNRIKVFAYLVTGLLSIFLTPVAAANVLGSAFQNLNPAANQKDSTTVSSSQTLGVGHYSLGLFMDHAYNTLPYEGGAAGEQSRSNLSDSVTSSHLVISLGILDNVDIGLALPAIMNQSVDSEALRGQFAQNGVTEYRFFTKARVYSDGAFGLALAASTNINQTNNNPYVGRDGGPGVNFEMIADYFTGRWFFAGNLGYRMMNSGEGAEGLPIQPFGDQLIASTAIGYLFTQDLQGVGEIFASRSLRDETDYSGRLNATAEALMGVKYRVERQIMLHSGVSTELLHGTSTPDWRVYAGVQWQTMPPRANKALPKPVPAPVAPQAAIAAPTGNPQTFSVVSDVLFAFNSSRITQSNANKTMESIVSNIQTPPEVEKIIIEGHTCNIGSPSYNRILSKRRAEAIKDSLVKQYKIPAEKIETVGVGSAQPTASNNNKLGRAKNRRVEFKIFRKGVPVAQQRR